MDVLSKFAWLIPLQSKHTKEVKEGLDKLRKTEQRRTKPLVMQTDKGT